MRHLWQRLGHLQASYEKLRAQQVELEICRDRYAFLYNLSPFPHVCLDRSGCIIEINLQAPRLLSHSYEKLFQRPFSDFVVQPDLNRFRAHLSRCRERGGRVVCELRLKRRGGDEFPAQLDSRMLPTSLWPGS